MSTGGWAKYIRKHGSPLKGLHRVRCIGCNCKTYVPSFNSVSWGQVNGKWYCGQPAKLACHIPFDIYISGLNLKERIKFPLPSWCKGSLAG